MPPVRYVLDVDGLSLLYEHVGPLLKAAGRLPVVIPELAWNEALQGKHGAGRQTFMTAIAGTSTAWDAASVENQYFVRMFSGTEAKLAGC